MQEKRVQRKQPTEKQLYTRDLERPIKREKRREELKRLLEVQEQKKVWKITVSLCLLFNLIFIILAYVGYSYDLY